MIGLALFVVAAQVRADAPGIHEYVLRNDTGMVVRFLNLGAIITAIEVPDRTGKRANVVLGYGSAAEYRDRNAKNRFGAVVGRYAGRITNARFAVDGRNYQLKPNDGVNALHGGGSRGLDAQLWQVRPFHRGRIQGARLTLVSPDGAQGFPASLLERSPLNVERDVIELPRGFHRGDHLAEQFLEMLPAFDQLGVWEAPGER